MVNIPNRLLTADFVRIFYHDASLTMLEKSLRQAVDERPSYVTKHAVSIVLKGRQRISTTDGQSIQVAAGQLAFVRQGLYTVTDLLAEDGEYTSFHFFMDDRLLEDILSTLTIREQNSGQALFAVDGTDYIFTFLDTIRQIKQQLNVLPFAVVKAKIIELFGVLLTTHSPFASFLSQWRKTTRKSLVNFMNDHYDKAFSIEDYASLTGRSVATFRREFKLKFEMSPKQWIIQKRMEKAKQLLTTSTLNVQAIAMEVGYENASYFIQAYKKQFGETPSVRSRRGIVF
ncbi:MAG: helix-turn-helix domain-containing protein [Bacteroidota bacterium]